MPEPLNIFVSYSRQDKRWLKELQVHLKPLVRDEQIHVWDDTRIKSGARWKDDIREALDAADVAILLVSHHFLASDFIIEEELQPLLRAAEEEGLVILPVIVGHSLFKQTPSLSVFQAVNDPERPLGSLRKAQRGRVFVRLAHRILEARKDRQAKQAAVPPPATPEPAGAVQETRTQPPARAASRTEKAPSPKPEQGASQPRVEPSPAAASEILENTLGMRFVLIPAGTFEMGSNAGYDYEKPVHRVTISQPFYLGVHEVTQGQWNAVMGNNPSHFTGDDTRPVESVSWNDVQEFIGRLNGREGCEACYRLPTEAEWEYACRAGSTTAYCFGDDVKTLADYAWYAENAGSQTHPVGQKQPNAWGLYDVHGNVWEWVADWYGSDYYKNSPVSDPQGPESGSYRVVRGGGWYGTAGYARSASRGSDLPGGRSYGLGFRLVRAAL